MPEKVILVKKSKNRDEQPKSRVRTALVGFGVGLMFTLIYGSFGFMGVFLTAMGSAGATPEAIPTAEVLIAIAGVGGFVGVLLPVIGLIWGATQVRFSLKNVFVAFLAIGALFACSWFIVLIYFFSQAPA